MKIAVCVPSHNEVKAWFSFDLAYMVGYFCSNPYEAGSSLRLIFNQSSILPSGRHDLVKSAMEFGATHILWLDSDMRFPKDTLHRLLAHDKDIVAANYTTRRLPIVPVAQDLDRNRIDSRGRSGLQEVYHCGLGVCLMKTVVIEAMDAPYFMFGYLPSGKFVGEDVYFLHKARGLGFKVWIDHDLTNGDPNEQRPGVEHLGEYAYDMGTLPVWDFGDNRPGPGERDGSATRPGDRDVGAGVGLPSHSNGSAVRNAQPGNGLG